MAAFRVSSSSAITVEAVSLSSISSRTEVSSSCTRVTASSRSVGTGLRARDLLVRFGDIRPQLGDLTGLLQEPELEVGGPLLRCGQSRARLFQHAAVLDQPRLQRLDRPIRSSFCACRSRVADSISESTPPKLLDL